MSGVGRGKRVQVFIGERDTVHGRSLASAILDQLRHEGAAGATVTRGVAGFGAHGRLHAARLADLASPLPLVITWIDTPERVERLLPGLAALVAEGLIIVDEVEIVRYSHRDLAALDISPTVADVMTREVVTVSLETPLDEVVERVVGQTFRGVPVVGEDGRVVGIITNADLVERGGLPARVELLAALDPPARRELLAGVAARRAADVMTLDPVTVRPDAPLGRAIALMLERQVKRLPVVAEDGRLVGIVSRTDVLRALGTAYPPAEGTAPATPGSGAAPGAAPGAAAAGSAVPPGPAATAPTTPAAPAGAGAPAAPPLAPAPMTSPAPPASAAPSSVTPADAGEPPTGQVPSAGQIPSAGQPPTAEPRAPATLADLMRRYVPVVRVGARLAEVLDAVVSTRLNRAVVIDDQGRVLGVVSDADVLRCLAPTARPGLLGALMRRGRLVPPEAARLTAAELMGPAALATPTTTVEAAARLMIEGRHKILPVVDEHGLLLGIVDRADLLARAGQP